MLKFFVVSKWPRSTVLLVLLFLFTSAINGQPPPLVFKNFNVNDGLSHSFVRCFLLDSRGFMWVATIDGLNKFDGYTFKTYRANRNDTINLSSNNISTLAEDSDGNIWVGTWGGGICVYDRKSDRFKRIPYREGTQKGNGLSSKFIYVSYKDSKNRIWIGTSDQGLFLADAGTLSFTQFAHDPSSRTSLSHNGVHAITEDDEGKLWIATLGGGINHFNPETGQFTAYMHKEDDQQSLTSNVVTHVLFDSKKRLWIATANNTLSLMQNGKFRHFKNQPDDPRSLLDYHITAIEEYDNKIWIGTDFGLMLFNEVDNNFYHYQSRPFDRKSLPSNQIKTIYTDREGRLWIGMYNGGVSMFDQSFVRVLHYYTYLNENSLSFNDVSAFLRNDDGSILVGTDGGGLNIFDRGTGMFTHHRHDPNNARSIGSNYVKTILRDRTGKIWLGLWGSGLTIFDRKRQIFIPFGDNKTLAEGSIGKANVTCLAEDNDGVIWVSTWGNGVYKLSQDRTTLENFVFDNNDTTSVSNFNAWAIYADSKNNIWVGNSDGVLDLHDRKKGGFIHFNTTPPGKNSTTGILVISEDRKGRIWVGLEGGGLKLLDQKSGSFKSYDIETGLPSDYINSIEEDQHGYLWIGTNNGICRLDPETGKTKNYGVSYGLQSPRFNRQASTRLASGEMMFGGVNGFNIFHPDSLTETSWKFPIAFTGLQVFNKNVPVGKKGSPLSQHINETSEITLPYKASVFSLEYAALNFMGPENIRYKYRLKGFVNEDWQDVGPERKVTYTNLDPDTYTFEVKASGSEGSWNEKEASLLIHILPPWWKTWWFKAIAIVFVLGSALGSYKIRVHSIKLQNKKLENLVTRRTEQLQQAYEELLHRDEEIQAQNNNLLKQREALASRNVELQLARRTIEAQNKEIRRRNETLEEEVQVRTKELVEYNQQLEQFAFISAHNLRAPVARILGLGNVLELVKNEPEEEHKIVNKLVFATRELDTVVRDLTTILVLRKDNTSVLSDVGLEDELRLVKINLEKEILETEASIQEDFSPAPVIHTIKPYLDSVLINLVSNAIKYRHPARRPVIQIKSETVEESICLMVGDNGLGINLDLYKGKLFTLYSRFHNHVEGKGMGLYLVKTQVAAMGGRIEVESEMDRGTTFKIFFRRHQHAG